MRSITFDDLAYYLRHCREIEFVYEGRQYSITNHSGFWYLCDDTDHILLDTICRFEEKDILVSKIAATVLEGMAIEQIFDGRLYDAQGMDIL